MSIAAAEPVYCRLTVLAPHTRANVALPADLPVAELVPMVLELVGAPVYGLRPRPWRLLRLSGEALPAGGTLRELGVLDGELLRIAPDEARPAPPVFDDPADGLAATAGAPAANGRFRSGAVLLLVGAAATVLAGAPTAAVAGVLRTGLTTGPPVLSSAVTSLFAASAAAVAVACAARLARRANPAGAAGRATAAPPWTDVDGAGWPEAGGGPGIRPGTGHGDGQQDEVTGGPSAGRPPETEPHPTDSSRPSGAHHAHGIHNLPAATTAALAAVVLAAVAGWAALPEAVGPARLLLATAAAGIAAAAAQLAMRTVVPALLGVLVAVVPVGLAALAVVRWAVPPASAAIGVGALALAIGPLLPRAALWLAGVPRPLVPGDAAELVAADRDPDRLPAPELAARAHLARAYLAGLAGGCAGLAAAAALPAAAVPGWAGPTLAALTVTLLGLRARGFVDARPARAVAVSALVAGLGPALVLADVAGAWTRLGTALGLLLAAVAVSCTTGREPRSPIRRRALDLAEGLLTAAAVPLALGVLDLYGAVRAL